MDEWLLTPTGRYLLGWEQQQLDQAVGDVFGFHAVQLGLPQLQALANNRMPYRWVVSDRLPDPEVQLGGLAGAAEGGSAAEGSRPVPHALVCDYDALPFESSSLDLVVLPHTLELSRDPHHTLREVERVLVPEGRIIVLGLNPVGLWPLQKRCSGLARRRSHPTDAFPQGGELIGYWRLRDWLRLLSFDIEAGRFGCYRPAVRSDLWLARCEWLDRVGHRWWPVLGGVYMLQAVKRVRGMRLIGPAWKQQQQAQRARAAVVPRRHSPALEAASISGTPRGPARNVTPPAASTSESRRADAGRRPKAHGEEAESTPQEISTP